MTPFRSKLSSISHSLPAGSSNNHFLQRGPRRPGHQTARGACLPGRNEAGSDDLRSASLGASFTSPPGDALPLRARDGGNGRCSDRRGARGLLLKAFQVLSGEVYGRAEPCLKRGRAGRGGRWRARLTTAFSLLSMASRLSLLLMASRLSSRTPRGNTGNGVSGSKRSCYKATCLLKLKSTFCKREVEAKTSVGPAGFC